jgi:uncharacterized lipoprotein YmbA
MRTLALVVPVAAALALSACASTGQPVGTYSEQERALAEDCAARGGILVPREDHQTGRPQADNVCKITGDASRLNPD